MTNAQGRVTAIAFIYSCPNIHITDPYLERPSDALIPQTSTSPENH